MKKRIAALLFAGILALAPAGGTAFDPTGGGIWQTVSAIGAVEPRVAPATLTVGNAIVDTSANAQDGYWTTDTSGTLTVCQSTDSWNVHYDADSNTLTLKDATIKSGGTDSHGIYAQSDNPNVSLTILLDGKNSVAGKETGIYVEAWMATGPVKAVLTLKKAEGAAEGSLTASGEEESGAGIYVEAHMSADSGGSGGSGG